MIASLIALALAATPSADIDKLAFMAGCWTFARPNGSKVDEQWFAPAGGAMVGMSRTVRDGKLRDYEFMRILPGDDGKLRYVVIPSGQPESTFPVKDIASGSVTFEAPEHDFPQRILYRLVDKDTLTARIEGSINGQARSADFPYKRCSNGK
jgi:hypothetical protein